MLHRLQVLLCGVFHETTCKPDGECVLPCMDDIVESPDDPLVVCRIHLLSLALQAQLEPLHWFVCLVAALHAYQLQDVLDILSVFRTGTGK